MAPQASSEEWYASALAVFVVWGADCPCRALQGNGVLVPWLCLLCGLLQVADGESLVQVCMDLRPFWSCGKPRLMLTCRV